MMMIWHFCSKEWLNYIEVYYFMKEFMLLSVVVIFYPHISNKCRNEYWDFLKNTINIIIKRQIYFYTNEIVN